MVEAQEGNVRFIAAAGDKSRQHRMTDIDAVVTVSIAQHGNPAPPRDAAATHRHRAPQTATGRRGPPQKHSRNSAATRPESEEGRRKRER